MLRVGKKRKRVKGPDAANKLPGITPHTKCRLRLLKQERIKVGLSYTSCIALGLSLQCLYFIAGLFAHGGGVHQKPGEVETTRGEK